MGYSRSRARCIPLHYPSIATRGVKQAPSFNKKPLKENHTVVSSSFQEKEKENITYINLLTPENTDQVSQSESGMFYELSSKKIMECEKYQDCSWFQTSAVKSEPNNKLSAAETIDSFIGTDEFDLPIQCASSHISPWADEYLEVFTSNMLPDENCKLVEKSKNCLSDENFYDKYKYEETGLGTYNLNFTLKKTDSTDSMKNFSSTNPAEIIPISFKEKLSNSNYGLGKLNEVKSEVKEEIELHSLESNSHLHDSDENDLNIGREEVVEVMDYTEDVQLNNEKDGNVLVDVSDYPVSEKIENLENYNSVNINFKDVSPTVKTVQDIVSSNTNREKLNLNFDIAKLNFEPSLHVNTPDLDFMDLVEFINEEIRQESSNNPKDLNLRSNKSINRVEEANQDVASESESNTKNIQAVDLMPLLLPTESQSSVDNALPTDSKINSTVDFSDVTSVGFSIAERIKTTAKRKTRKDLRDFTYSDDEESYDSSDDDDDYCYKDDIRRRRRGPVRSRTKSSASESKEDGKSIKEETSNYREKRDKNNEASRRSRLNRKAREKQLFETLEEEERRNVKLKAEADILDKQVTSLRQLLLQVVLHKGGTT